MAESRFHDLEQALLDSKSGEIVIDAATLDAHPDLIHQLLCAVSMYYVSLGGDGMVVADTRQVGNMVVLTITPHDRPPSDDLFRLSWWGRFKDWLGRQFEAGGR